MPNALNMIEEVKEIIESTNFTELTKNQLSKMVKEYNTSFGSMQIANNEDYIIFYMSKNSFNKFEYYCGMEYARDDIKYKIETEDDVIIIYDINNERACEVVWRATGKQIGNFEDIE